MGFEVLHDRAPALLPTEFGLRMAREHARRLGPLPVPAGMPAAAPAAGPAHDPSGARRAG
jgi:hypothetical protein